MRRTLRRSSQAWAARIDRRATALIVAIVTLMVVMLITGTLLRSLVASQRHLGRWEQELQAQWLAEAALARAQAQLARHPDYASEQWQPAIGLGKLPAAATIRVERTADRGARIVAAARYPDKAGSGVLVPRTAPALAVHAAPSLSPESSR
jgi:type II secretory pathway component PulK